MVTNKEILDSFFQPLICNENRGMEIRTVDSCTWLQLSYALDSNVIKSISVETEEDLEILKVEFLTGKPYIQKKHNEGL